MILFECYVSESLALILTLTLTLTLILSLTLTLKLTLTLPLTLTQPLPLGTSTCASNYVADGVPRVASFDQRRYHELEPYGNNEVYEHLWNVGTLLQSEDVLNILEVNYRPWPRVMSCLQRMRGRNR